MKKIAVNLLWLLFLYLQCHPYECRASMQAQEINNIDSYYFSPRGPISKVFQPNSSSSLAERNEIINELQGKVVEWNLYIETIEPTIDGFNVITESEHFAPVCNIELTFFKSDVTRYGDILKPGNSIWIKGAIAGSTEDGKIKISPAILVEKPLLFETIEVNIPDSLNRDSHFGSLEGFLGNKRQEQIFELPIDLEETVMKNCGFGSKCRMKVHLKNAHRIELIKSIERANDK